MMLLDFVSGAVIFIIISAVFYICYKCLKRPSGRYNEDWESDYGVHSPNSSTSILVNFSETNEQTYYNVYGMPLSTKGPSGLKNIEEYCYMNSMIQAMASSEALINDCSRILDIQEQEENCQKMTLFGDLLENINRPKDRFICVQENTDKLKELMKCVKWDKVSQQDTFQLLSAVINSVQKDMNNDLEQAKITMPPKFMLLHTFSESSGYNKVQDHLALALPLCGDFRNEPGEELNTLMDEFFRPSIIDDGPDETQISLFQRAPNVLILHIQANEWNDVKGAYIKPKYFIRYKDKMEYEFNIHMEKDGSKMEKVKVVYNLTAVVHHMGTISGGHYVTYRTHAGAWYLTNDEQVEEISFKYDKVPYIMVYEKDYI